MMWFLAWSVVIGFVASEVWRRRARLFNRHGMGMHADVERLYQLARVCVSGLTMTGRDVARLGLSRNHANNHIDRTLDMVEGDYLVALKESDSEFELLHRWLEHQNVLGVVLPPQSRIIRLRCLDDLQPLTLRRLDA
ncbi:MAG TPA: hypothetical protein VK771_10005 [Acidimicrobiia bacterium]|nr:hypothetical protein [Acidimicrobiia bacterium]